MPVMRTPQTVLTLGAAAVLGAAGGAVVVGVADDGGHTSTTTVQTTAPASQAVASETSSKALSARQVYDLAKGSVAFVTANVTQQTNSPFGGGSSQSGTATGTGFVVSKSGELVTNFHVVEGASSVKVKIGDGTTKDAKVIGTDESDDLALLKVDPGSQTLTPLVLGDSDTVQVGDPTYAIGNPFGLDRTLTTGVVSALQRQISAPNGFTINGVLQTDAAINPGNSGGPLLDSAGHVIGVNSQIESTGSSGSGQAGNVGIGFAVPSNTVRSVVQQLENGGTVKHAYLGVQTADATSGTGAQVAALTAGGPAQAAGIQKGDVITSFDGKPVQDAAALSGLVNAKQAGDKVTVTVKRSGSEKNVTVTLAAQPAQATAASSSQSQGGGGQGFGLPGLP
jgi:putative serine protease PepD